MQNSNFAFLNEESFETRYKKNKNIYVKNHRIFVHKIKKSFKIISYQKI